MPGKPSSKETRASRLQLSVAIIAAVSALVGALVGGGLSYLGTKQQVAAQADQARDDFFRSQKKDAYAAAVKAEYSLYSVEQNYLQRLFPAGLSEPSEIDDDERPLTFFEEDGLRSGYNSILDQHSVILMLGSTRVANSSDGLALAHKNLVDLILDVSDPPLSSPLSDDTEAARQLDASLNKVIESRSELLTDVRDDLGVEDADD